MNSRRVAGVLGCWYWMSAVASAATPPRPVDQILADYVKALGGQAAVDKITTREVELSQHHETKVKLYWEAPNKVLRLGHREREGFDGSNAWFETKRKRIQRLQRARQDELETDANPIRYVHLHDLYHELNPDNAVTLDSRLMDVIAAPNQLGATKFFFDHEDHLLYRIEDSGETSAYFKYTTDLLDYKEFDGVKIPVRIMRSSEEPGGEKGDLHLSGIKQNIPLDAAIFRKPDVGRVISGGKH